MSRLATLLLLAAMLALAACDGGDRGDRGDAPAQADAEPAPADDAPLPADDDFERTWLGVLPCADCDGIQTRLRLERDGERQTYALEETYLGAEGEAVFAQEGRWVQEDTADGASYRLDPGTPGARRYLLRGDGALDQLDGRGRLLDAGGQYRLQRL